VSSFQPTSTPAIVEGGLPNLSVGDAAYPRTVTHSTQVPEGEQQMTVPGLDPLTSLAFALASGPGRYALLLGSGVSSAAGIPTGWQVVERLIQQVAAAEKEPPPHEPEAWYRERFGQPPNYAELLDMLARTREERSQLLRSFFEPTEEERAEGLKSPTPAHRAIARLVRDGYVRVVVTTNFDRLLEDALRDEGVVPTVLANADAISGSLPLVHGGPVVVKLHGDYLDTRILNTSEELEKYPPEMDTLLDRILDEFGLVVCGWSGQWDTALRTGIERCPSRRFTTYWATVKEPTAAAQTLIGLRDAQVIRIENADQFFSELQAKVEAVVEAARPHPASIQAAVAAVKRILGPSDRIRLHDMVMREAERVRDSISAASFPTEVDFDGEELATRLARYDSVSEVLRAMLAIGCFWQEEGQRGPWAKALDRVANPEVPWSGKTWLLKLRLYPALECLCVAGVAALAGGRVETLVALFTEPIVAEPNDRLPLAVGLEGSTPTWVELGRGLPGMERHYTPMSERLQSIVREDLTELVPDDRRLEDLFDMFEYLWGLTVLGMDERRGGRWGPTGAFTWRHRYSYSESAMPGAVLQTQLDERGEEHPLMTAGWLGGSLERIAEAKAAYDALVANVMRQRF
jgi:hypothetical protein